MYNNKFFALLAGMLLFAFAQGFAQQDAPEFNREIVFGANTGGGTFNPRVLYKRTNKKRTLRVSLTASSNSNSRGGGTVTDTCQSLDRQTTITSSATLGLGYEKRKEMGGKFSFYHGMEFRLGYSRANTNRVEEYDECTGYYRIDEYGNSDQYGTISWYPFIGLRYQALPRLSLAVEAGPQLGFTANISNSKRTFSFSMAARCG